jgi:response regulator RpfG family c-di-GMP phosphodiesterase
MQRTDITNIFPDATKEQIDSMMKLYGDGINGAKGDVAALNQQLKAAQEALEAAKNTPSSADELAKAKAKLQKLETELTGMKAAETVRQIREKVASEKKIPAKLLTGETEEVCAAQADAILTFAGSQNTLSVGDGGEAQKIGASDAKAQFAEWAKNNFN